MKENMLYNLDTSIWIDYYEKRNGIGKYALKLIEKIAKNDDIIIYSDIHITELEDQGYNIEQINLIFKIAKPNYIRRVHTSDKQLEEARRISSQKKIPRGDALHAILSRDNFAILVSKDHHFNQISYIAVPKSPKELI